MFKIILRTLLVSILTCLTVATLACGSGSKPASGAPGNGPSPTPTGNSSPIAPTAFGLEVINGALGGTWPTIPFGSARLWDTETNWVNLEPSRGTYDWTHLDTFLSLVPQNVDVIYTFGHEPCWATAAGTCNSLGWSAAPPTNIQDWNDFVTALVQHVGTKVRYYEVWNEPNSTLYWTGSPVQLVALAKNAYPIIKTNNPNAVVLSPGVARLVSDSAPTNGVTWASEYLSAGGTAYTDILAYHNYMANDLPELVAGTYADMLSVAAGNGLNVPLWVTEGGYGGQISCLSSWTTAQCTGTLARWYLIQLSQNAARVYWYSWDNLYRNGQTGAIVAYGQVEKWLIGASFTGPCSAQLGPVWSCNLTRPGGYQAQVVWNPNGASTYTAASNFSQYRDLTGSTFSIPSTGAVSIGIQPIILETGTPQ